MLPHRKDLPVPSAKDKWGQCSLFNAASSPIFTRLQSAEHMDQSPNRTGFFGEHGSSSTRDAAPAQTLTRLRSPVAQGLVNLNHNGPDDGGLMILKGSSSLVEEYVVTFIGPRVLPR